VINRRALLHDCRKTNLTMRSHKPDAKGTGTIFQIALDGVDEGLELAGADYVLRASFTTGMLDSAAVEVVHLPSLDSVHIWRAMDCVVPLLRHLQQPQQPRQAPVHTFALVPGETTVWDLTLRVLDPDPAPAPALRAR